MTREELDNTVAEMVRDGQLRDTGLRRKGEVVWGLTEWGKALALAERMADPRWKKKKNGDVLVPDTQG